MNLSDPDARTAGTFFSVATRMAPGTLVAAACITSIAFSIVDSRLSSNSHEWGLMYATAADFARGLVPYREIFIQYGLLTTILQSLSLALFGNCVVSIGVMTGIFYAVTLWMSWHLLQKVLPRWLACLSVAVIFLVHPYSIYPWSNYFMYPFFLLAVWFLAVKEPSTARYLLSGVFLGLGFLARQSIFPMLAPLYLYFFLPYIFPKAGVKKAKFGSLAAFHSGLVCIIGIFLLYLAAHSAFHDWVSQSFTILGIYRSGYGDRQLVTSFLRGIFLAQGYPFRDGRMMLYSVIFFNTVVLWALAIRTVFWKRDGEYRDLMLLLYSTIVLFGYLQSFHIYEVFRLQNAASLGIGLLLYTLYRCSAFFGKWRPAVFAVPVCCLLVYLCTHLFFIHTSSVCDTWNRNLLFGHELREPVNIPMLKGKLFDLPTRTYYESIAAVINEYHGRLPYLVNYSRDAFVPLLSPAVTRVQRCPFYSEAFERIIFADERGRIGDLLKNGQAILAAGTTDQIPKNYSMIVKFDDPEIYLAVPFGLSGSKIAPPQ